MVKFTDAIKFRIVNSWGYYTIYMWTRLKGSDNCVFLARYRQWITCKCLHLCIYIPYEVVCHPSNNTRSSIYIYQPHVVPILRVGRTYIVECFSCVSLSMLNISQTQSHTPHWKSIVRLLLSTYCTALFQPTRSSAFEPALLSNNKVSSIVIIEPP